MAGKNYAHQLDAKNRMRIPAKLREELGSNYSITVGTGGCLYVYTQEQMQKVKETLNNVNAYREKQLKAARYILYNTWEAEEDKQGRILIPQNLKEHAGLKKDIVFTGVSTRAEIWDKEKWEKYTSEDNIDLNEIAIHMSDFGI